MPVPADCTDGFTAAYWRPPDARLARDLADRSWQRRHASLLALPELDVGYRLVVAELA